MRINEFINDVSNQIKYKPIRMEISEELEIHMNEIKNDYLKNGLEEQKAEISAVLQMGDAKKIGKSLNKIHRPKLDWKLFILLLFLMGFGIITSILLLFLMGFGIITSILKQTLIDGYNFVSETIWYMTLGVLLGICLYFLDYRKIKKYSNLLYILATLVMLFPIITYNRNLSFSIFNISFMPCILSIPLYIIAFVGYIDNNKFSERMFSIKLMVLTITSLLILSLTSFFNTIILATIYLIISISQMKRERKIKFLVCGIILYLLLSTIFIIILKGKLKCDTGLLFECRGYYIEVEEIQNEILANANLFGRANTEEISNSESIIYEQSQYTLIALLGNLGILPVFILVLIIALTGIRIVYNAKNINDNYGKLMVTGLGMLYIIQSIINIFMNIKGSIRVDVNLPFITYGATYFIVNICCMSIILSIYRRKDIIFGNVKQKGFIRKLGQLLIEVDKKLA